jgi:hypothetical protein
LELFSNDGGATWYSQDSETLGAFDVLLLDATTAVPEPCSWLLLTLGAGMLGAGRLRRRKR